MPITANSTASVKGVKDQVIVRGDGTNNGVWFNRGLMCIQNEETGRDVQIAGKPVRIPSDHRPYRRLLGSGG